MRDIGLVLSGMERQYGFLPKVLHLGYCNRDCEGKVASVRSTRNFALIFEDGLETAGYSMDGVLHECKTPALVHIEPHIHKYCQCNRGPCRKLYMSYSGDEPFFGGRCGVDGVPVLSTVVMTDQVLELVYRLLSVASGWHFPGLADQIDLLCSNVLMGLLAGRCVEPCDRGSGEGMHEVMDYIRSHCIEAIDFSSLPHHFGLSPRTFIRHWKAHYGVSPKRYQLQCRLELGKRYLLETSMPVYEIGKLTGFSDQFAFAKAFHGAMGQWPTEFRGIHNGDGH